MLQAAFYRADVRDTCPLSSSSLRWTGTAMVTLTASYVACRIKSDGLNSTEINLP
jgi:hypothetical protein